jgi:hypothetical protein
MNNPTRDVVKRNTKYVLVLIVLLNMLYPITGGGDFGAFMVYTVLYAGLFVAGIVITSDSRAHITWSISVAVIWFVMAVLYGLDPTSYWKTQVTYFILLVFHGTILSVMLRYIFTATAINADVLYAAAAVYFLIAFLFVPLYGMIETASPGSFVDVTRQAPVQWQQFVYFSLVTMSSTGYGDILPVSMWARMLAGIEMTSGVLYVAILMARLVSLYDAQRRETM